MSDTRTDLPGAAPPQRKTLWLVLGLVAAVGTLVGGAAWTFTSLGGLKQPQGGVGMATEREIATAGKRRPSDYDLPTYPTAFEFHSLEMGRTEGSVAYSVKKTQARQVADFYKKELPKSGWSLKSERTTSLVAGEGAKTASATGWKQRWVLKSLNRKMTLQALDLDKGKRPGQIVLNWSPLDE